MTKFTKEFIDSQIKLYGNATPGIWSIKHESNVMCGGRSIAACGGYRDGTQDTDEENKANAEFIAAAHMHYVDALLEIVGLKTKLEMFEGFERYLERVQCIINKK